MLFILLESPVLLWKGLPVDRTLPSKRTCMCPCAWGSRPLNRDSREIRTDRENEREEDGEKKSGRENGREV
jgi:hypothetical protein